MTGPIHAVHHYFLPGLLSSALLSPSIPSALSFSFTDRANYVKYPSLFNFSCSKIFPRSRFLLLFFFHFSSADPRTLQSPIWVRHAWIRASSPPLLFISFHILCPLSPLSSLSLSIALSEFLCLESHARHRRSCEGRLSCVATFRGCCFRLSRFTLPTSSDLYTDTHKRTQTDTLTSRVLTAWAVCEAKQQVVENCKCLIM